MPDEARHACGEPFLGRNAETRPCLRSRGTNGFERSTFPARRRYRAKGPAAARCGQGIGGGVSDVTAAIVATQCAGEHIASGGAGDSLDHAHGEHPQNGDNGPGSLIEGRGEVGKF